jgi:hypothetical protein
VCFKAQAREGDSCILPDTALCGLSGKYLCAGTAAKEFQDAECYKLCGSNGNITYENCQSGQSCALYPQSTLGVCTPALAPTCLADLGVKCASNDDCATGLCTTKGADRACSRTCSLATHSGCPQGSTCLSAGAGDNGFCWPTSGNVTAPKACANKSGCGCSGGAKENIFAAALVMLLLAARQLRRRGAQ